MKQPLINFFLKWFTVPGFMSFTTKDGNSYRITGYYYRYYYDNGKCSDPYPCERSDANCICGYGVCGAYIPFSEVKSIKLKLNKGRFFFFKQYLQKSEKEYILENRKKVALLKSFPQNLSKEELDERLLDWVMENTMKLFKR